MSYKTPELSQLREMLEMLIGPAANANTKGDVEPSNFSHTAVYVDKENTTVATCSCDLKTAAALGCSLSLIPPAGAEGMVSDGVLSENASQNLYEVMNIFSSLMMDDKSPHLKLDSVVGGNEGSIEGTSATNACFSIELGAYGEGTITFNAL